MNNFRNSPTDSPSKGMNIASYMSPVVNNLKKSSSKYLRKYVKIKTDTEQKMHREKQFEIPKSCALKTPGNSKKNQSQGKFFSLQLFIISLFCD